MQPTVFCNLSHEATYKRVRLLLLLLAATPVVTDYIYQESLEITKASELSNTFPKIYFL